MSDFGIRCYRVVTACVFGERDFRVYIVCGSVVVLFRYKVFSFFETFVFRKGVLDSFVGFVRF